MENCFPGTTVARNGKNGHDLFDGLFFATSGLVLSQVKEITGLDTSTIQNWVNRGWVQKPVDKRYGPDHLARIIIINMLRDTVRLEVIGDILAYINGEAGNADDDIIRESELYCYLCNVLDKASFDKILDRKEPEKIISSCTTGYTERRSGDCEKLITGIRTILVYYSAAVIKNIADGIYIDEIRANIGKGEGNA